MNYVIALDLQGLLVELRKNFDSYTKARQYLHDNYKSFKDLKPYIIEYDGDHAIYGEWDKLSDHVNGWNRHCFDTITYTYLI